MVGGQMLDMKGEGQELDLSQLSKIHEHKTGKLLTFPFVAAGIVAQKNLEVLENLKEKLTGQERTDAEDLLCRTALEGIYHYHMKMEGEKNE